jgi:hypothetical protein
VLTNNTGAFILPRLPSCVGIIDCEEGLPQDDWRRLKAAESCRRP